MNDVNPEDIANLERTAFNIRKKILRMIKAGKEGHIGGAMSCVEIMTALYFKLMRIDKNDPEWINRDRFVLSAGHKSLALYATLAEKKIFKESLLDTYHGFNTKLPGHPDMHKLPGVEASTGAMGHGLAIAGGMALAAQINKLDYRVYVILGDGEIGEGSNWESFAAASHYKLDNLIVFVDRNGLQISGSTSDVMNFEPLDMKLGAFGWEVRTINGHDIGEIVRIATDIPFKKGKPSVIIADTVKAKGLTFAENKVSYHYWNSTPEEIEMAERDLEKIGRHTEYDNFD
jgi:transketolase